MKKSQMLVQPAKVVTGASSTLAKRWQGISWDDVKANVRRLQMRIAKAERASKHNKVKALQWLLTHSLEAKLLAVKKVTASKGAKTSGVDGKLCVSDTQKMQLALSLKQRGYRALPLRRVYIPKKNGDKRPLGIPTMSDRAMQALYLLALEPVAEMRADPNSYGFRPCRSAADAEERCFKTLANKGSAQWILEGDIKACFDKISHDWLLNNIPIEKRILRQWLSAGYLEKQTLYPTPEGTPQGGVISPVLANMALDGLEAIVANAAKVAKVHKGHTVRYADDFACIAASREALEDHIKPAIINFLKERGLELSVEKTVISHVYDGFDFLGFNVRKNKKAGKLLVTPAKKSVHRFLAEIRAVFKINRASRTDLLIGQLNPKIRGWAYYYRHVVSKTTFEYIDDCIYQCVSRWTRRRHNNKNFDWIRKKYFRSHGLRNWIFFGTKTDRNGKKEFVDLIKASSIPIIRHTKIRQEATPYDPAFDKYFAMRKQSRAADKLYHYWHISNLGLLSDRHWIPSNTARLV